MISDLLNKREDILYFYSPYSFLPKPDKRKIFDHSIVGEVSNLLSNEDVQAFTYTINGYQHVFLIKHLEWDSRYFGVDTFRLLFALYDHKDYATLKLAVKAFVLDFFSRKDIYCFSEIPSEDIWTIQALNESGFKLVENRLTYYLDLDRFSNERYTVREATVEDIPNLKNVARKMRNEYDRFHAETLFSPSLADEFLATYIEQSVKGYADYNIVPAGDGINPDSFLTAKYLFDEWEPLGEKISKMVLSAVSSDSNKGWYIKLISEMAYHLKEKGAKYAFMHPATTNRAVIHTYEKLGCKYGKCVHVLTFSS